MNCSSHLDVVMKILLLAAVLAFLPEGIGQISAVLDPTQGPGVRISQTAPESTPFDDLFALERTIRIQGTEENPVFTMTSLAVRDDLIVVLDQSAATVTAFDTDGTVRYQVGRPGGAPGEFTNPFYVGFDLKGRLAVVEGWSNHRIQFLTPDTGASLDVVTNDLVISMGTSSVFFEGTPESQRVFLATEYFCTNEKDSVSGGRACVAQEYDLASRKTIRRFAPEAEIAPKGIQPWVMAHEDGVSYITSGIGPDVFVYNAEGKAIDRFPLEQEGAHFQTMDPSVLPKRARERAQFMAQREFSTVDHIAKVNDDLIVQHNHRYPSEELDRYVSVYGTDGTHKATTERLKDGRRLTAIQGDRFYFVESNEESDLGDYVIREYRYTGPPS